MEEGNAVRGRRSPRASPFLAALLAGCAIFQPGVASPWDAPVDEALSTTDWGKTDLGQLRPGGGGFASVDALLAAVVHQQERMLPGGEISTEIAGTNSSGTVVAFVRQAFPGNTHPLRAIDLRLDLRDDDGSWVVARAEQRFHCAVEEPTEYCE